jgi:hypothetical protein
LVISLVLLAGLYYWAHAQTARRPEWISR